MNNDDFTVVVSEGSRCHCVNMCTMWQSHSKWLSEYSKESASNFALSLNVPPWKLFRWFRRPQLWATGDWQLHHNNAPAHVSCLMQGCFFFFGKTSNHPGDSAPLQSRFGVLELLAFPKTKITFEREEIWDHQWDSEKYNGAADGDWENCIRPKVLTLKGTEVSLPYAQCFLYLVSSAINTSIFHIAQLDTFWTGIINVITVT